MSNEKPTMPNTTQPLETIRTEKFSKIYTNSCQLEVSPWDFTFTFGELKRLGGSSTKVEEQMAVIMSPQHAKALLGILASNVSEYEKQVGEIKLPTTESQKAVATVKSQ
jgi:hypothetical protein